MTSATPVEGVSNPDPFEPQMRRQDPQQQAGVTPDGFVQVRCVCNRLLCEATPGSRIKIVCPRCGALVRWPTLAVEVLPREKPRGLETKGNTP